MTKGDRWLIILAGICLFGVGWLVVGNLHPSIPPGIRRADHSRCLAIKEAITQFHTDYGRLPLVADSGAAADSTDRDTDTSADSRLIAILLGAESGESPGQNPNNTNYLEGVKPAQLSQKSSRPGMGGLVEDRERQLFSIVDLWGTSYRVRLDANGDNELANLNPLEIAEGRRRLPYLVMVWSAGVDRNWDTWEDNPKSWD